MIWEGVYFEKPTVEVNHLYRIGVLMGMTATTIEDRGLVDGKRTGRCVAYCAAPGVPVCLPCAVELATRTWLQSNPYELRHLHPQLLDDAKRCVVNHLMVTGFNDPGYEPYEVIGHLRDQARLYLSLALPASGTPGEPRDGNERLADVIRIS